MQSVSHSILPKLLGSSAALPEHGQIRSEEKSHLLDVKLPLKGQHASSTLYFIAIILFSLPILMLACIILGPQTCMEVQECADMYKEGSNHAKWISRCFAAALVSLFMREVVGFAFTCEEETKMDMAVLGLPDARISSGLLCACLLILSITEMILANSDGYDHAVPPLNGFRHEWGSVQTFRYGEWLVNVPLLLLIAGHVALGSPISEMLPAIALTNLYIVLSWASLVVTNVALRWLLIVLAFGLYAWTTYDMTKWVQRYLRVAPARLSGNYGRVYLLAWLNLMFAIYGSIFLLDAFGWIDTRTGHAMYEVCDCTAKAVISYLFAVLRSRERCDAMKMLVAVHSRMARASFSVLRSSFDYIIPCTFDDSGSCIVFEATNADVKAIEALTGKSLAGSRFTDILNSQRDRDLFDSQVQTGLQQEENDWAADLRCVQEMTSKGASFWASRPLPTSTISLASTFNYDLSSSMADGNSGSDIPVSIHLSSAVGMSTERDSGPRMLIALRLIAENDTKVGGACASPISTAAIDMQRPVRPPSSDSVSARSKRLQRQRLPGELIVESDSVCSSMSSHASPLGCPPDPSDRPVSAAILKESFFSCCLSDHSKDSLFQYSVGWPSSLASEGAVKGDGATQTSIIQLEESSTQTSILGSDAGFHCTCCARPPPLPQNHGNGPIQKQNRGSRKNSRRATLASPRSTDVGEDVARSSMDVDRMSSDEWSSCMSARSSSTCCATTGFDGYWILSDMSSKTVAFMSALRIEGWKVTDAEGTVSYLRQDQRTGDIMYEGGVLFFQDNHLIRVGKTGRYYLYKRGLDGKEASGQHEEEALGGVV